MFDWEDIRHFVAVAKTGTLSGAAKSLKVDHATVSRRLEALERDLAVKLVDRLPRKCVVTAAGQEFLEFALKMEDAAYTIDRISRAKQGDLTGSVVISAPPVLVINHLAGLAASIRSAMPGVQLTLIPDANAASLSKREADLAVRLYQPLQQGLIARRMGTMEFALYAAAGYPHRSDPENWEFITYDTDLDHVEQQRWTAKLVGARPVVLKVNDMTSQRAAASAGMGVALLPRFIADDFQELKILEMQGEPFCREIWLGVHADLRKNPTIRGVMDILIDSFRNSPMA